VLLKMGSTAAEKKVVKTLSQRIVRNVKDSRLVKLIDMATRFSLTAEIKLNGRPVSSILTFFLLVFGIIFAARLAYRYIAKPLLYPVLRHFFYRFIRRRSRMLPRISNLTKHIESQQKTTRLQWALIYGATSHIG